MDPSVKILDKKTCYKTRKENFHIEDEPIPLNKV